MRQKFLFTAALIMAGAAAIAQKPVRKGTRPAKVVHEVVYEDAPPMYDINKMNGKWLEVKRTNTNGNPVSYSDSLMIMINNGKGFAKTAGSMDVMMKGDVVIERGNVLNIAGANFTVQQADASSITVKDDGMIKLLTPVTYFSYEAPQAVVKQDTYKTPVSSSAKTLEGKWQIYKRQAPPGFITETTPLIKWINFTNITGEAGFGSMSTYNGSKKIEEVTFSFTLANGMLTLKTANGDVVYSVYKSDADEFVFGKDGELMNYSKR